MAGFVDDYEMSFMSNIPVSRCASCIHVLLSCTSAGLSPVMGGDVAPKIPIPQPMDNGSTSEVLHVSWEPIPLEFSPVFYMLQYTLIKPNGTTVSGKIKVHSFYSLLSPVILHSGSLPLIHVCICSFFSILDYEHNVGTA